MISYLIRFILLSLASFILTSSLHAAGGNPISGNEHGHGVSDISFPMALEDYTTLEQAHANELNISENELSVLQILKLRAIADPINLVATLLFLGAIMHTFASVHFMKLAHKYEHENDAKAKADKRVFVDGKDPVSFKATLFHFLGEIEAIFGHVEFIRLTAKNMADKTAYIHDKIP